MKILASELNKTHTLIDRNENYLAVEGVDIRRGYGIVTAHVKDEGGNRRDLTLRCSQEVAVVAPGRAGK